jgi:hypothetical protein
MVFTNRKTETLPENFGFENFGFIENFGFETKNFGEFLKFWFCGLLLPGLI